MPVQNTQADQNHVKFWIIVPGTHPVLEKCLLSIKGQIYKNYQVAITANSVSSVLSSIFSRLSLPKDTFIIIDSIDQLNISPDDIIIALKNGEWFIHAHVLYQFYETIRDNLSIVTLCAEMSEPYFPSLSVASQANGSSEECVGLPDISFASQKSDNKKTGCTEVKINTQYLQIKTGNSVAIATIITPDYLTEAILSLSTYQYHSKIDCNPFIFVASDDYEMLEQLNESLPNFTILDAKSLKYETENANIMAKRYSTTSNEYRWAMKSVVLSELLKNGYDFVLHLDPDIYVVDGISDLQYRMLEHEISLFPHFRNPDIEDARKFLYADGFFNGGMLGVTSGGLIHLGRLTERCKKEMTIDRKRNLFCEQKYLEWFIFEADKLFINKDKGINYTIWNSDPMEGLIGPSQRSYLLRTGYFPRIWHMQANFMTSVVGGDKYIQWARPIVLWYLLAKVYLFLILSIKSKWIIPLLGKRFHNYLADIGISAGKEKAAVLFTLGYQIFNSNIITENLRLWGMQALSSIGFDNFALYANIIEDFFPNEPYASNLTSELRGRDFKYLSDNGFISIKHDLMAIQLIIQERMRKLADWGIIM